MPSLNLPAALARVLPFLARDRGALPRGEILALKPSRRGEIAWETQPEEAGSGVTLTVPRKNDTVGLLLSRVFHLPSNRRIELDEFGSQVWQQCDGAHSVEQLIQFTCAAYKLNRRQGEVSVIAFMKMLAQRRLIDFSAERKAPSHDGTGKQRAVPRKRPRRH